MIAELLGLDITLALAEISKGKGGAKRVSFFVTWIFIERCRFVKTRDDFYDFLRKTNRTFLPVLIQPPIR